MATKAKKSFSGKKKDTGRRTLYKIEQENQKKAKRAVRQVVSASNVKKYDEYINQLSQSDLDIVVGSLELFLMKISNPANKDTHFDLLSDVKAPRELSEFRQKSIKDETERKKEFSKFYLTKINERYSEAYDEVSSVLKEVKGVQKDNAIARMLAIGKADIEYVKGAYGKGKRQAPPVILLTDVIANAAEFAGRKRRYEHLLTKNVHSLKTSKKFITKDLAEIGETRGMLHWGQGMSLAEFAYGKFIRFLQGQSSDAVAGNIPILNSFIQASGYNLNAIYKFLDGIEWARYMKYGSERTEDLENNPALIVQDFIEFLKREGMKDELAVLKDVIYRVKDQVVVSSSRARLGYVIKDINTVKPKDMKNIIHGHEAVLGAPIAQAVAHLL